MGDDLPDLPMLQNVGLACLPARCSSRSKSHCQNIFRRINGGQGCVRDVIEKVIEFERPLEL